jgi:hypothetical protein
MPERTAMCCGSVPASSALTAAGARGRWRSAGGDLRITCLRACCPLPARPAMALLLDSCVACCGVLWGAAVRVCCRVLAAEEKGMTACVSPAAACLPAVIRER